jgi:iron complex transport system substrate-binding protein
MRMTSERKMSEVETKTKPLTTRPPFLTVGALLIIVALAFTATGCMFLRGKLVVTDDAGREIVLDRAPQRIVSMAPSNTEILFALGLGDRVVGVTTYCNYPPEAVGVAKVGDSYAPDYERIVSLKPDIILAVGTADSELVKGLEGYGLKVFVLQANSVAEVPDDIELVGRLLRVEKEARDLANSIRTRIQTVSSRLASPAPAAKPSVFWCLDNLLWTVGPGSFVNDVITLAGGQNIGGNLGQPYGQFSLESLLEADPEVIIIPLLDPAVPGELARLEGWGTLTAVRTAHVYQIDPDIVSRPGPRIAEAVEQVAALLHPILFGSGGQ